MSRDFAYKIKLIKYTISTDNIGNPIKNKVFRSVFAKKVDVFANDYYNSLTHNKKLEQAYTIRTNAYENEEEAEVDDVLYTIERVISARNKEFSIIRLSRKIGDSNDT